MLTELITIGEVQDLVGFSDAQLQHMAEAVCKHAPKKIFVDKQTIKHCTLDFVFGCVVKEISVQDPIMGAMAEKLAEMQV